VIYIGEHVWISYNGKCTCNLVSLKRCRRINVGCVKSNNTAAGYRDDGAVSAEEQGLASNYLRHLM